MERERTRKLLPVALVSLSMLALGLRALRFAEVFPGDGSVDLMIADSAYHARRALFSFVNFPSPLVFDAYMAFPDGARVPMPPLYDWSLAAVARLFGSEQAVFERVAAWSGPVLAALSIFPVYVIGRAVGGRGIGLGSALLFALLPASVRRSWIGDVDHHAAVALLGATWLALSAELLRTGVRGRRLALLSAGMALVRAALILSWSGSLLYVAVGEGALLLAASIAGTRPALWGQAAGALAAAALVAPWLAAVGPSGDRFGATDLSWLHVVALAAAAASAAALAALGGLWRHAGRGQRLGLALLLCAAAGALAWLALPPLLEALGPAWAFVSRTDSWGARNPEQQPLFWLPPGCWLPAATPFAARNYAWFAYAIPLGPLAVLWCARDPRRRALALCLAFWTLALGILAIAQVRFGGDLAPAASVAFALLLAAAGGACARLVPRLPASAAAVGLAALLLWPAMSAIDLSFRTDSPAPPERSDTDSQGPGGPPRLSGPRSQTRFARMIRRATPETAGFLDSDLRPEYSVLCHPSHGHSLHYWARRATPANNFGPYLDREKYEQALAFYAATSEAQAIEIAEGLGARYVMTWARDTPGIIPPSFADRLHRWNGAGHVLEPPTQRFRLIVAGPPGGVPMPRAFPSGKVPKQAIPYKLFELVAGAVLQAQTAPGSELEARLRVNAPPEGGFLYRALARADGSGRVQLRVPYATDTTTPVRADGPYLIRLADAEFHLDVSESAVREGATIAIGDEATPL